MLWTIFVILLVLWLFGLVSSYTMGGFIHLLLVIAVVVFVIQLTARPPDPTTVAGYRVSALLRCSSFGGVLTMGEV